MDVIRRSLRSSTNVHQHRWISRLMGMNNDDDDNHDLVQCRVNEISSNTLLSLKFVTTFSKTIDTVSLQKVETTVEFHSRDGSRSISAITCRLLVPSETNGTPRKTQQPPFRVPIIPTPVTWRTIDMLDQWDNWLGMIASYITFDQNRRNIPIPGSFVTVRHDSNKSTYQISIRPTVCTTFMKTFQLEWIWDPNIPEQERLVVGSGGTAVTFDQTSLDALVGLCENDIASTIVVCLEHALGTEALYESENHRYEAITGRRRSDYEVSRLERIQRNQEKLRKLGLLKNPIRKKRRGRPPKKTTPEETADQATTKETGTSLQEPGEAETTLERQSPTNGEQSTLDRTTDPHSRAAGPTKRNEPTHPQKQDDDNEMIKSRSAPAPQELQMDGHSSEAVTMLEDTSSSHLKDPPGTTTVLDHRAKAFSSRRKEAEEELPIQRFFKTYSKPKKQEPHPEVPPPDHEAPPIERFLQKYWNNTTKETEDMKDDDASSGSMAPLKRANGEVLNNGDASITVMEVKELLKGTNQRVDTLDTNAHVTSRKSTMTQTGEIVSPGTKIKIWDKVHCTWKDAVIMKQSDTDLVEKDGNSVSSTVSVQKMDNRAARVFTPSPSLTPPPKMVRFVQPEEEIFSKNEVLNSNGSESDRPRIPRTLRTKQKDPLLLGILAGTGRTKHPGALKRSQELANLASSASPTKRIKVRLFPKKSRVALSPLEQVAPRAKVMHRRRKDGLSSLELVSPTTKTPPRQSVARTTSAVGLQYIIETMAHRSQAKPKGQGLTSKISIRRKGPRRHAVSPLAGHYTVDSRGRSRRSRIFNWQSSSR